MKHAYTVYLNDFSRGLITDDNMIICDANNLVLAINKLLDKGNGKSVCIKRCELLVNERDTDEYRMNAWGKGKDE